MLFLFYLYCLVVLHWNLVFAVGGISLKTFCNGIEWNCLYCMVLGNSRGNCASFLDSLAES